MSLVRRRILTPGAVAAGLALAAAMPASAQAADTYVFDPSHTYIGFVVDHLGFSQVRGRFASFDGTLVLDTENLEAAELSVTIDTASVDTGWAERDDHLRDDDFFDVEAHPAATFVSTAVTQTGENTLAVTGDFTLLGVTQPITLDVTVNRIGEHPFQDDVTVAGFSAVSTIRRSDFGMDAFVAAADDPSTGVGDEISLVIEAEMTTGG